MARSASRNDAEKNVAYLHSGFLTRHRPELGPTRDCIATGRKLRYNYLLTLAHMLDLSLHLDIVFVLSMIREWWMEGSKLLLKFAFWCPSSFGVPMESIPVPLSSLRFIPGTHLSFP